jgi:hypothetical protein
MSERVSVGRVLRLGAMAGLDTKERGVGSVNPWKLKLKLKPAVRSKRQIRHNTHARYGGPKAG